MNRVTDADGSVRPQTSVRAVLLAMYRVRGQVYGIAAIVLLGVVLTSGIPLWEGSRPLRAAIAFVVIGAMAVCVLLVLVGSRLIPEREVTVVSSPVHGRWLGNHVTIRGATGEYAAVAHLQHDSVTVRVGARVRAGEQIARCGNSGNSSEPHVHAQLMDRASPWTAQGLPLAFAAISLDDVPEQIAALPATGQHMTAPAAQDSSSA